MEQGDQSHRASEQGWPQRLHEWDRPVPASRLTMPCWRCAEAESRRAEMAEPRRLGQAYISIFLAYLGVFLVLFAPPDFYYQKEQYPLGSRRRRQRLADRWIAIFKALPDQSARVIGSELMGQAAWVCRPMAPSGSRVGFTSSCCPRHQAELVIPIGGNVAEIIAISGALEGEFLRVAEMLGADAALNKPVSAELLLAPVAEVLKAASLRQSSQSPPY